MKLTLNKLTQLVVVAGFALTASHAVLADNLIGQNYTAGTLNGTQYIQEVNYGGMSDGYQYDTATNDFTFTISDSMPNLALGLTNLSSYSSFTNIVGNTTTFTSKDIGQYTVSLTLGDTGTGAKVGASWTVGDANGTPSAGNLSQTVSNLAAGTYTLVVTTTPWGLATTYSGQLATEPEYENAIAGPSGNGARFSVSLNAVANNITPVPEPESYALMLAGLGLVAFAARRNNVG